MNRRDFFKKTAAVLGTLLLLPGRNRQAEAVPNWVVPLFSCWVAGFQYHEGPAIIDRLRPGDRLALRREPDNPYDRRAIAVYAGNRHLGYIPRAINTIPADMMEQGQRLAASIRAVDRDAPPWLAVKMEVGIMR